MGKYKLTDESITIPTNITVESLVCFAADIGCEVKINFVKKEAKKEPE